MYVKEKKYSKANSHEIWVWDGNLPVQIFELIKIWNIILFSFKKSKFLNIKKCIRNVYNFIENRICRFRNGGKLFWLRHFYFYLFEVWSRICAAFATEKGVLHENWNTFSTKRVFTEKKNIYIFVSNSLDLFDIFKIVFFLFCFKGDFFNELRSRLLIRLASRRSNSKSVFKVVYEILGEN